MGIIVNALGIVIDYKYVAKNALPEEILRHEPGEVFLVEIVLVDS